jgi:hypothetical protein
MISFYRLRVLLSLAALQLAGGFLLGSSQSHVTNNMMNHCCRKVAQTPLFMADHSAVTSLSVGDAVTVVEDVLKAGKNLRGLSGTVIETWEKCDVDPTCCCAEFVDENLAVHVRFNTCEENELFGNDTFIHYFAEAELDKKKEEVCKEELDDGGSASIAFDGLSCTAFKLDKLKMGEQAKRIAKFEESRKP